MHWPTAHRTLTPAAIAALCIGTAGCGDAGQGPRSTNNAAASRAAQSFEPSLSVTGDYDRDDSYADGRYSDGDNDDAKATDRDNDSDNRTHSYYDDDDSGVRRFGHPAGTGDRRAVEGLVKRYFTAASAEDGAAACSMIVSIFAKSVPEDLGRPPGPVYARGSTCATVMSKIFAHYHRQLAIHAATLRFGGVRVSGGKGVAVLAFKGLPGRQIHVAQEKHVWKMDALLDLELP
jgi:hypothetical protein